MTLFNMHITVHSSSVIVCIVLFVLSYLSLYCICTTLYSYIYVIMATLYPLYYDMYNIKKRNECELYTVISDIATNEFIYSPPFYRYNL